MSVDTIPVINLLPWREGRQGRRLRWFLVSLGGVVTLTLLVVAGVVTLVTSAVSADEHRNASLAAETALLQQRISELDAVHERGQQQWSQFSRTRHVHAARLRQTRMLAAILAIVPHGLALTELRYEPSSVQLRGSATSARYVGQWLRLLQARPEVASAELQALYLQQSAAGVTGQHYAYHICLRLHAAEADFVSSGEDQ